MKNKLLFASVFVVTALQGCHCCEKKVDNHALQNIEVPPVAQVNVDEKPKCNTVYFEFNSSTVNQSVDQELTELANYVNQHQDSSVRLEGHTDLKGSDAYNDELGKQRANALAEALAEKGVAKDKITIASFGKRQPIHQEMEEALQAANRRVVIELS